MTSQSIQAPPRFPLSMRIFHWVMAAMVLTMLFIGAWMVVSFRHYHALVAIHRPLGIAVLLVAALRFANRLASVLPPFPATMSHLERHVAHVSELILYGLLFLQPLVGWGMLSAGGFPITLFAAIHLPRILPADSRLYFVLRRTHTVLAYLLFATFLAHLSGVLYHTIVMRDGLLRRMSLWPTRA